MDIHRVMPTAAALLVASGCLFDYRNPAEALRSGEASGAVVADQAATGTLSGYPGVSVSLKGAAYDQTTRETGRFALLDLPVGRHTILFRKGTVWALERDVEIAFGKDGQPEGVDLGKIVLSYAAAVEGSFELPAGNQVASGVAVDETTGQTTVLTPDPALLSRGTFRFPALGVGTHLVKVMAKDANLTPGTWVGGQVVVAISAADQGSTKVLAPIPPHAAAASGRLRFRVQTVGPGGAPAASLITLVPDPGIGPITPDSQGFVDVSVPEGFYQVILTTPPVARLDASLLGPQAATAVAVTPPPAASAVVIEGKVAEVGTVYLVADLTVAASVRECVSAADCGGLACSSRLCAGGYSPPPGAAASLPFCPSCDLQRTCVAGPGVQGSSCNSDNICVPVCGTVPFACTTDGTTVVTSNPSGC